jgi:hypothetical protein
VEYATAEEPIYGEDDEPDADPASLAPIVLPGQVADEPVYTAGEEPIYGEDDNPTHLPPIVLPGRNAGPVYDNADREPVYGEAAQEGIYDAE